MNIKKKNNQNEDDSTVLTKAEEDQIKRKRNKEIKKKLKKLGGFEEMDGIVDEVNPITKKKNKKAVNIMDSSTLED